MDRIRKILAIARGRIALAAFVDAFVWGLVAASIVAVLAVVALKLVPGANWGTPAFLGLVGITLAVTTAILMIVRRAERPTDAALALRVDERLRLDERLVTALALERSTDAYARAAVADAVEKASDPALPAKVRAAFPVRVRSHAVWAGALLAGAIAGELFIPAYAWPEEEKQAEPAALASKKMTEDALERVKQELESSKALPQDVKDAMQGLAKNAEPRVGGEADASDERREAIQRMTELQKKLDEVKKSESARANDALKRDLQDLQQGEGEMSKFTEQLSKGDFSEAKQELADLSKKLESDAMTDAEKAAVKQSLENVAKSLENLASKQQSLKGALQEAGLDAQLASNPEALKRAIEQAQNLSEQQREELKKAVAAAQKSQQALKKFASAAKKAAQNQQKKQQGQKSEQQKQQQNQQQQNQQQQNQQQQGQQGQQQQGQQGQQQQGQQGQQQQGQQGQQQQGQQGQQGEQQGQQGQQPSGEKGGEEGGEESLEGALGEMSDMLNELEVTEQMLQEAEALSNMAEQESQSLGEGMCKGGQCQNPGESPGQSASMSPGQQRGMQGGRAQGGNTGKSKTPTGTKTEKAKSKNAGGDIIARQLIENPNPEVGQSVIPSESTGSAAEGGAGAAVAEEAIPAGYQGAHKHYFGTLKKKLGGGGQAPSGAKP